MSGVQRYGFVIRVKREKLAEYERLHADTWPGVLAQITRSNIRNYSIFVAELEPGQHFLFAYYEYVGDDHEADMRAMAQDEETLRWWQVTDPCQEPITTARPGEHWSPMKCVFYHDATHD
ncbi:MAG: L-rhamnose mutarotase [Planctomycetes bacterium]|nr:L-rhamnose mutarotase [Planctomycetota bacterium]MCB9892601.1 L-rhamnose mutarotase [Planctomycetota bacterium]MCB9917872.1 L-rhamnose mutarotase [Planctomycetota bacterium]